MLAFLIAATGQWEKAMITVYLCGISVLFAMLIGIADRHRSRRNSDRLWRGVQVVIDTLQTLPSFVYLMPAVMLFRVGDFTAHDRRRRLSPWRPRSATRCSACRRSTRD